MFMDSVIRLTDAAAERIKMLIDANKENVVGIRVGVKAKGLILKEKVISILP